MSTPATARLQPRVGVLRRASTHVLMATSGVNALAALMGSVGGIVLAHSLGAADRGHLVTALLWPNVTAVLASLGITTASTYLVARERARAGIIAWTATCCGLCVGALVAGAGAIVLAPLIARTGEVRSALNLVFIGAPIFIAGGVLTSVLQAVDLNRWNAARSVQPCAYLALVAVLAAFGRLTVMVAAAAYLLSIAAQLAVTAGLVRGCVALDRGRWSWTDARSLYSYGPKVTISALPQIVNLRVDQLLLSVLPSISAGALGNYAVAVSMATLSLPIAVAAGSVAFPRVAEATRESTRRSIERRSLWFAVSAAGAASLLIALLAPLAVPRLFGAEFDSSVRCVWLLAPGAVCLALNRVLSDILRGRGRPLRVSGAEAAGAIVTAILLPGLVPTFGIFGAAAASSAAYATILVVMLRSLWGLRRMGQSGKS